MALFLAGETGSGEGCPNFEYKILINILIMTDNLYMNAATIRKSNTNNTCL